MSTVEGPSKRLILTVAHITVQGISTFRRLGSGVRSVGGGAWSST